MSKTNFISDWTITDSADTRYPLTFEIFQSYLAVSQWQAAHAADLRAAVDAGTISGVHVQEHRTPAQFILSTNEALDYLAFGARKVRTVYCGTIPVLVIGIPQRHARWLCARLQSGLVPFTGPYDTLEDATEHAGDALLSG